MQLRTIISLLILLVLGGCGGSDIVPVSGKITLDGKPVTSGTVVFESPNREVSVIAPLNGDGAYEVRTFEQQGLPPGEYLIAVRPGAVGDGSAPLVGANDNASAQIDLPARYANTSTSDLAVKISAETKPPVNFHLATQP